MGRHTSFALEVANKLETKGGGELRMLLRGEFFIVIYFREKVWSVFSL